jgi:hypothetical protein
VTSILFWNIAKNPSILEHLTCLIKKFPIDVILLAESPDDLNFVLSGLNGLELGSYIESYNVRPKVRALTRLHPPHFDHLLSSSGDIAIWSIRAPRINPPEVLLAAVHLPAKMGGQTDVGQAMVASRVAAELAAFEDSRHHRNTVIVGDFNMNPYDPGMIMVDGIHALMTRRLAQKQDRSYRNSLYRRFYNPMWGLFGDRTHGPAGTHFWRSSLPHNTHWAMHDQVLLRPNLIGTLTRLEILDQDGEHGLLAKDGHPDKNYLSDHLPILLELDI